MLVTGGLAQGSLVTRGLGGSSAAPEPPDPLAPYGSGRGGGGLPGVGGYTSPAGAVSKVSVRQRRAAIIAAALAYYWSS